MIASINWLEALDVACELVMLGFVIWVLKKTEK